MKDIYKKKSLPVNGLYIVAIISYFIFQIIYLNLPFRSFIQLIIYIQFPIYFWYFNSLEDSDKVATIYSFSYTLKILFPFILGIAIIEIFVKEFGIEYFRLGMTNRGVFQISSIGSIYGSTTSLAHFCTIFASYLFIEWVISGEKPKYFNYIYLNSIMIVLTYSRKEILIYFAIVILFLHLFRHGKIKVIRLSISALLLIILYVPFIVNATSEANKVALSQDYIRTKMLFTSVDILQDNLPFGTGIGTYGSQMSVFNNSIYDKYLVERSIVGTKYKRGPIYDLFLVTFTTEVGIGVFIYILYFIHILSKAVIINDNLKYYKTLLLISIFGMSLFSPIIMNSYGLLLAATLGIIAKKYRI